MDHLSSSSTNASSSFSVHGHKNSNNKGKTRNTKRSTSSMLSGKLSTDPQSVAARERRHRISARFKILQSMVPGGAKMDTVSMLDEAISYVKFLKAQIWYHHNMLLLLFNDRKTTSSSWTYSPTAVGEFEQVYFGHDDAYAPVTESNSQVMPLNVTDSEYFPWFGSVDDHQEKIMHGCHLS